ncbi:Gpi16 subunit, GPI transamidase component [Auriscalpium vulgare]|uniref:Gpi16 subunit, GPI transamidase component n=1 Tax=Auriscalpium vulgare TaxID=40419 RepID=A0ACB8RTD4_9AGAM|nr:Gpi16 subunit, GPI transamidase component [Auriscalpium vulgare]
MQWLFLFSIALATCSASWAAHIDEEYNEELVLRALPNGKLAARFAFSTLLKGTTPRPPTKLSSDDASQHYTLFPLALGQLLREYAVTELHLTLNAGKWDYDSWGYPDEPGVGTGAELWTWMGDGAPTSIDERWKAIQNAFAGLFCASLGGMDTQRTTSPTRAFPPTGAMPHNARLRHATLPAENVCTENLTPFLKLLPCPAHAGIAALLAPHRVFDADWHGLGVHVRWRAGVGVELVLTVQAVMDPVRTSVEGKRDWSLRSLFDRTVPRACPVASSSHIKVFPPSSAVALALTPEPFWKGAAEAVYEVSQDTSDLDIAMRWPEEAKFTHPDRNLSSLSDFSVRRTLQGTTQTHGRLTVVLRNNRQTEIQTLYLETMPWHVEFYLHTLTVTCLGGKPCDHLFSNMTYIPPVPHAKPALLQAVLTLPPLATVRLSMNVRKSFLRYTEHPPDAQRGWELPPAVFIPVDSAARRMYTSPLLVDLPTPDFSMPYNVIIMSCTLIALLFGSLFNLFTRRFVVVKVYEDVARTVDVDDTKRK